MRMRARASGRSLQGNHVGAPVGCAATRAPSSSSSQPIVPHRERRGAGAPAYTTSIENRSPAAIRRGSFTRSFRGPAVNAVRRSPSTRTRVARSLTRSRLIAVTGIAATAFTTATPDSRLVRTR